MSVVAGSRLSLLDMSVKPSVVSRPRARRKSTRGKYLIRLSLSCSWFRALRCFTNLLRRLDFLFYQSLL